jgi:hypothetical protein
MADWTLSEHGTYDNLWDKNVSLARPTPAIDSRDTQGWNEVAAATQRDYHGFWVQCTGGRDDGASTTLPSNYMLYLGIGSAGNEIQKCGGFHTSQTSNRHGEGFYIPMYVPKGTRLSVGALEVSGSGIQNYYLQIYGIAKGWHGEPGFTRYARIGSSVADDYFGDGGNPLTYEHHLGSWTKCGTAGSLDLSASSWFRMLESCPFDVKYIIPTGFCSRSSAHEFRKSGHAANSGRSYWFQIAQGASGSQQPITPILHHQTAAATNWVGNSLYQHPGFPCYIPRGTPISARCVTDYVTSTNNGMTIYFHAFG